MIDCDPKDDTVTVTDTTEDEKKETPPSTIPSWIRKLDAIEIRAGKENSNKILRIYIVCPRKVITYLQPWHTLNAQLLYINRSKSWTT